MSDGLEKPRGPGSLQAAGAAEGNNNGVAAACKRAGHCAAWDRASNDSLGFRGGEYRAGPTWGVERAAAAIGDGAGESSGSKSQRAHRAAIQLLHRRIGVGLEHFGDGFPYHLLSTDLACCVARQPE